jgi:electron transfer flavoprotein alpha subunit
VAGPDVAPRLATTVAILTAHAGGHWLAATSTITTELAARLAAALDAGLAWALTALSVDDDGVVRAERTSGNDTIVADATWTSTWGLGLFRPHAFDVRAFPTTGNESIDRVDVIAGDTRIVIDEVATDRGGGGRQLAGADVIVSAGRGIGDPAQLDLVRELASLLGGVAGVSLPLVELGWAPRSMQVGQTGTIVAPLLYVACGISGQIQHRVGMERSGTIVAINTDPNAPIMGFCDLAVVADVKSLLPRLIELLKATR